MENKIPWERYQGEDIEQVIATFICRQRALANDIRPSQGDHGIDILAANEDGSMDVYQVKKFTSLNSSRRNNIRESWKTFLKYKQEKNLCIRKWFLVMPMNPTLEDLEWFNTLFTADGIDSSWIGLSEIEGWHMKMPEVVDYYLNGGRHALENEVRELLKAAQSPNLDDPKQFKEQMRSIEDVLDSRDPHYSYSIRLFSKFESTEPPIESRAGLVATIQEKDAEGRWLVIDVIAKHGASSTLEPITGTVTFLPSDDAELKELQDFIDFGAPLSGMPGKTSTNIPFFNQNEGGESVGRISTISLDDPPSDLTFQICSSANHTLPLLQSAFSSGSKGFRWKGADSTNSISLSASISIENRLFSFDYEPTSFSGKTISSLRRTMAIFRDLASGTGADLEINGCPQGTISLPEPHKLLDLHLRVYELLETLNRYSNDEIVYPDITHITNGQVKRWEEASLILESGSISIPWTSLPVDGINKDQLSLPVLFTFIQYFKIDVQDTCYFLSPIECTGIAESVSDNQNGLQLLPGNDYPRKVIERVVGPSEDDASCHGRIFISPAPSPEIWEEALNRLSDQFSILKNKPTELTS